MENPISDYRPDAPSLMRLLHRLRAPNGCPWDRVQTRQTLSRCLKNECAEVLDAIDGNDRNEILDELGDLLMNTFMQIVIAEENGEFNLDDVFGHVISKMIRRHEHVFGKAMANTPEDVLKRWDEVKSREPGRDAPKSAMDGVQKSLSALDRSEKIQKRAAEANVGKSIGEILDDIGGALDILRGRTEISDAGETNRAIGRILFSAVGLARLKGGTNSEELLRKENAEFERRFRTLEASLQGDGMSGMPSDALKEKFDAIK